MKKNSTPYEFEGRIPLTQAIPLGLQHVMAMFIGNLTPLIIVMGLCGLTADAGYGALRTALLQNAMIMAGIVTLVLMFSIGPVGGKVPIVMGTSSGFLGVLNNTVAACGGGILAYSAIMGACIVGGIFDETMLALRGCAGLELVRVPFQCAVSIHHRLAEKDHLRLSDLYGENLMLMHRGWSHYVDQLRDDLWQHHPQIHIIDFDFYNMDILNRCESSSNVLLSVPGWANVHPLLKSIPIEWDYSIPFGILHSPNPSPVVQRFLDAAKTVGQELYG